MSFKIKSYFASVKEYDFIAYLFILLEALFVIVRNCWNLY